MKKQILVCASVIYACCALVRAQQNIDAYVVNPDSNRFVVVASTLNSLSSPMDLDFYPDQSKRPNELWILNQGTFNSGGSTVIVSKANQSNRTWKYVKDGNAWHFMALASSLAFGDSNWTTSQDILDANHSTGKYTGPTLWPGNLSIYGVVGNPSTTQFNGSHLDMIHQSPYGKGIAFERDNVYWVMSGYDGTIKRYDFNSDHGPGQADHGDGGVRVYSDFKFTRHSTLPAHIVIDQNRKFLYGCDPIGKRVFQIDITSGSYNGTIAQINSETLDGGYYEFRGITMIDTLIKGLVAPVGIDIYGDRLIISDNGTDEIIIYNISDNFNEVGRIKLTYTANPDPMGIKVGPDGRIYFVDKTNKKAYMIDNNAVWPLSTKVIDEVDIQIYPNPAESLIHVELADNIVFETGEIQIQTMLGKTLLSSPVRSVNAVLDISGLQNGIYLIQVRIGTKVLTQKIIKQ
ncbi:MAG: T9SS type A sorting domain-containing protein [Bacteroidetes bacterium]|nr:T9SS type A sorting domain-containing protein [Bacteroidota bacterium]